MSIDILFLDSNPSVHHDRFVDLLSSLGKVHSVFVALNPDVPQVPFKLVFFADLDLTIDYAINYSVPRVGISWAWDLQQTLRQGHAVTAKLREATHSLDLLIVDSINVEKIAKEYSVPQEQIFRTPYGIDIERYALRKRKDVNSVKLRLYTNRRWEHLYRPEILLDMAEILFQIGFQFELRMANDGSLRKSLLSKHSKLFNDGFCTWIGRVSQSQNIEELQSADLFISVSTSDGSSVSLLEAMAVGTPPLVTDNLANREWIDDNLSGFLFSGDSGEELAEMIQKVASTDFSSIQAIKMNREKVTLEANWEFTSEKLLAKLRNLVF